MPGRPRPTSWERGYTHAWRKKRVEILARDPWCVECLAIGLESRATTVDHIVPKHLGGTDDDENLRPLCKRCQSRKAGQEGNAAR